MRQHLATADQVRLIADREADIYDEFVRLPDARMQVLIRSCQDRRIALETGETGRLYGYLAGLAEQGRFRLKVPTTAHRQGREALLGVRFAEVALLRPEQAEADLPDQVRLWAIEIGECAETVPEGEAAIRWVLLSTHRVEHLAQARVLGHWYSQRWWVEQLFRVLKTEGLRLESSQFSTGAALKRLVVLSLHVALVVLQLVTERDGAFGLDAGWVFDADEQAFLRRLGPVVEGRTSKQQCGHAVGSLAWGCWIVARLGGWMGYQSGAPPGPRVLRRGLARFGQQYQGWLLGRGENQ